jgi:hypothetical protein
MFLAERQSTQSRPYKSSPQIFDLGKSNLILANES